MYTLYGAAGSGSAAIEMALIRCAAHYQRVTASSWEQGPGTEALKRLNPLLQVPTLQCPDGTVLTESAAILTCLALAFPTSGLLCEGQAERAVQLRSLVYIATNCYGPIGIIDYPERWMPGATEEHLAHLKDGARSRLHAHWDVFSDTFTGAYPWQPENPGAPEILASVVTQWSDTRRYLRTSRPGFQEALLQIDRHPLLAPVVREHWPTH